MTDSSFLLSSGIPFNFTALIPSKLQLYAAFWMVRVSQRLSSI